MWVFYFSGIFNSCYYFPLGREQRRMRYEGNGHLSTSGQETCKSAWSVMVQCHVCANRRYGEGTSSKSPSSEGRGANPYSPFFRLGSGETGSILSGVSLATRSSESEACSERLLSCFVDSLHVSEQHLAFFPARPSANSRLPASVVLVMEGEKHANHVIFLFLLLAIGFMTHELSSSSAWLCVVWKSPERGSAQVLCTKPVPLHLDSSF